MRGGRRLFMGALVAVGASVLFYVLPLFRVVPLGPVGQRTGVAAFDPVAFVDRFWNEQLIPEAARAVNASELLQALEQDRQAARREHGRNVGLGGVCYYFVAGTGRVVSIDKGSVGLSVHDSPSQVQVALETGNIFGNAVRDGTGLLNINDFASSQDFNALSSEINRRIEQQVLAGLSARLALGATVRFAGCAEVVDEDTDLNPLRVVPFLVETP